MKNGPYELVVAPDDYPGKRYRGRYCYEHHLVWWRNTGELVPKGHVLHHKNERKRDNRFANLELHTKGSHAREHASGRTMRTLTCGWCDKSFEREARLISKDRTNFFCCRSHQVRRQWRQRKATGR